MRWTAKSERNLSDALTQAGHVISPDTVERLLSHEVIIETISATTTKTGLKVRAELDTGTYEKGIKISDKEMKELEQRSIRRDAFHGEWNYAPLPAQATTHPTSPN